MKHFLSPIQHYFLISDEFLIIISTEFLILSIYCHLVVLRLRPKAVTADLQNLDLRQKEEDHTTWKTGALLSFFKHSPQLN